MRGEHFTPDDFAKIEAKMKEIVDRNETITREVWSRDQAARWFREHGEKFKAEWVGEIPDGEEITIYRQGNWLDMCTGPHLPSTGKLGKAFKLMKISGAYWRGDAEERAASSASTAPAGRTRSSLPPICINLKRRRSAITAASARR